MTSPVVACRVLGAALLIFAVILTSYAYFTGQSQALLASRGVHTYGTVMVRAADTVGAGSSRDTSTYGLTVEFPTPKTNVRCIVYVDRATYDAHQFGSSIEIVYDPQNLLHADTAANVADPWQSRAPLLFGIAFFLAGPALLIYSVKLAGDIRSEAPDLDEAIERAQHPGIR